MNIDTGIVLGLISLIGSVIVGYWGYTRDKKKADIDMVNTLLQKALDLNKQELQNVRDVNKDLKEQLEFEVRSRVVLQAENKRLDDEVLTLEKEVKDVKKRLEYCEVALDCSKKLNSSRTQE
jgi:predicted nuclease with TOPRIM domain